MAMAPAEKSGSLIIGEKIGTVSVNRGGAEGVKFTEVGTGLSIPDKAGCTFVEILPVVTAVQSILPISALITNQGAARVVFYNTSQSTATVNVDLYPIYK